LDFLLQKKFGKYTGWIAYTLSKVEYTFPGIDKGKPFPALHDQRHEVKLINSLNLGKFNLSGTFVYATGKPYTAPIGQYNITLLDGKETTFIHVGDKNSNRLPAYHRLDIAITYNFKFKKINGSAGISFFNIYNRKNIKYKRFQLLEFDPDTYMPIEPELVTTDVMLLGFVPSIFLNLKF
ncbi:MAG: TonB-dependent receptor, partial [Bacteroidota bacterium]